MLPQLSQVTPEQILRLERNPNLYARLGLEPGATAAEIDEAAGRRIEILHPDRHHGKPNRADYERATALIVAARDTLTNEHSYLKWCAQHGIPLDKFPPPPRRAEVVTSLEGESMPGGLSTSVLSEDPHLYHDVEYIIRRMPAVLAAQHFYLREVFGFHPGDIVHILDLLRDERVLRAARHPRVKPFVEPLLKKALSLETFIEPLQAVMKIFGVGVKEYPEVFRTAMSTRLVKGEPGSAYDILSTLLLIRRDNPELIAACDPLTRVAAFVRSMREHKKTFAAEAAKLVVDTALSAESLFWKTLALAKRDDDFKFVCEVLTTLPNCEEFLASDEGIAGLKKILVSSDKVAEILRPARSGISRPALVRGVALALPELLDQKIVPPRLARLGACIWSGIEVGRTTVLDDEIVSPRELLSAANIQKLDAFFADAFSRMKNATVNHYSVFTLRPLAQFYSPTKYLEYVYRRAMVLLTPPVDGPSAKVVCQIVEQFPEIVKIPGFMKAIEAREEKFTHWVEPMLQAALMRAQTGSGPTDAENATE